MICIIFRSTIAQLQPLQPSSLVNLVPSPPVLWTLSLINSCPLPGAPRHCGSGNDLGDPLAPLCSLPCLQEHMYHLPLRSRLNVWVYTYYVFINAYIWHCACMKVLRLCWTKHKTFLANTRKKECCWSPGLGHNFLLTEIWLVLCLTIKALQLAQSSLEITF